MKKYIAFLRGINVGGKNKISMPELKMQFEHGGLLHVVTYINSGNVIFTSDITDETELKKKCELLIKEKFQLNIPVTVVSAEDLTEAVRHAPSWWNKDKDSSHNAIFIIPPLTMEEVLLQVGESNPEYEQVFCYGKIIFWTAPRTTFSKTKWSKIHGTPIYSGITIRNANTTNKLSQLTTT